VVEKGDMMGRKQEADPGKHGQMKCLYTADEEEV